MTNYEYIKEQVKDIWPLNCMTPGNIAWYIGTSKSVSCDECPVGKLDCMDCANGYCTAAVMEWLGKERETE